MNIKSTKVSDSKDLKIVIMGLDNCGKTSIVLSLKKETNIMSFFSLEPTKRINIEAIQDKSDNLIIWDFGGQKEHREEYFEDFENHFQGTQKVIFVFDVQDDERYEMALDYLKKIIEELLRIKLKIDFSIFLHKYDPNLVLIDKDIDKKVSKNLISKIKTLLHKKFRFDIFKTSIFTVFDQNLIYSE